MYFPYVRGRQFELLALKELVMNNLIGEKIIPIIEPVKLSPTLINTIEAFIERGRKVAIVRNPAVGSFDDDWVECDVNSKVTNLKQRFDSYFCSDNVIKSVIIKDDAPGLLKALDDVGMKRNNMLAVLQDRDYIEAFEKIFSLELPGYIVVPDERIYTRRIHSDRKILLDDKFIRKERNADYQNNTDEFFSDDHLCYEEEKYFGFSDYSVIGSEYMEAGFAPYAVAIHIVYFDGEENLRVHHFVSESNDDISNPAMKYYEALRSLYGWYQENEDSIFLTRGFSAFLQHYEEETYPGLGTVKKLSLMHHLELMSRYLEGV